MYLVFHCWIMRLFPPLFIFILMPLNALVRTPGSLSLDYPKDTNPHCIRLDRKCLTDDVTSPYHRLLVDGIEWQHSDMEVDCCGLSFGLRGSVLVVVFWICGQDVAQRQTHFRWHRWIAVRIPGPSESKTWVELLAKGCNSVTDISKNTLWIVKIILVPEAR